MSENLFGHNMTRVGGANFGGGTLQIAYLYMGWGYGSSTGTPTANSGVYQYTINEDDGTLSDFQLAISGGTAGNSIHMCSDQVNGLLYVWMDTTKKIRSYSRIAGILTQVAVISGTVTDPVFMAIYGGYLYVMETSTQLYRYNLDLTGRVLAGTISGDSLPAQYGGQLANHASGPFLVRAGTAGLCFMSTTAVLTQVVAAANLSTAGYNSAGLLDGSGFLISDNASTKGGLARNYNATGTTKYRIEPNAANEQYTSLWGLFDIYGYGATASSGANRTRVRKFKTADGTAQVTYNPNDTLNTGSGYWRSLACLKH